MRTATGASGGRKRSSGGGVPDFGRNFIQLNSIAAGKTLKQSFFSASSDSIGTRVPGQRNYPVDGRGVIFSGASREPVVRGLTRPHSARLWRRRLLVDNSGYGEFGLVDGDRFVTDCEAAGLDAWARLPRRLRVRRRLADHSAICGVRAGR